jgi:hypothetical protein
MYLYQDGKLAKYLQMIAYLWNDEEKNTEGLYVKGKQGKCEVFYEFKIYSPI